jgi:hypothetical protein
MVVCTSVASLRFIILNNVGSLISLLLPEGRLPSPQTTRSDSESMLMDPAAARDGSSMDPLSVVEHVRMSGVS